MKPDHKIGDLVKICASVGPDWEALPHHEGIGIVTRVLYEEGDGYPAYSVLHNSGSVYSYYPAELTRIE